MEQLIRSPRVSARIGQGASLTRNPIERLRAFFSGDEGSISLFVTLCLPVLLLFVGFALDIGNMRLARVRLQGAADAAAVAAGMEIRQCGGQSNCAAMQNAVTSAVQENGYSGVTLYSNCATPGATYAVTLTINSPPCALGSSDPNQGKKTAVEVMMSSPVRLTFARMIGISKMTVGVRSEASSPISPPCVYALDPHGAGAISVLAGVLMNFNCGIVDESDSPAALACLVGLGISAPTVKVTGGAAGLLCGISNLGTGVARPTPADPLAYLPTPSVGPCGTSSGNVFNGSSSAVNILLGGTYTFNPGVYCGGIYMTAALAANITFNPGVYILKSAPGLLGPTGGLNLTLSLLSNIQGSGVTFYNVGPVGGFNITAASPVGLSNVALSAPTSGNYGGILFFQDAGNTTPGTVTANLLTGSKIEGAFYLPSAPLTYGVGALSSNYNIVVAKDVNFAVSVATTFGNDYSTLSAGSPLYGNQAALIQ